MGVERFSLKISAQIRRVARMEPGFEDPEFPYWLKFKCTAEAAVWSTANGSLFSLDPRLHFRGTLGLASGCFGVPYVGGESTLAVVECCGFEPIAYQFDMGWKIVGTNGIEYPNISLSTGGFSLDAVGVSVKNLKWKLDAISNIIRQLGMIKFITKHDNNLAPTLISLNNGAPVALLLCKEFVYR
ncbi:hypothetical protein WN943_021892 [Citrus x changshan-huyou]